MTDSMVRRIDELINDHYRLDVAIKVDFLMESACSSYDDRIEDEGSELVDSDCTTCEGDQIFYVAGNYYDCPECMIERINIFETRPHSRNDFLTLLWIRREYGPDHKVCVMERSEGLSVAHEIARFMRVRRMVYNHKKMSPHVKTRSSVFR